MKSISYCALNRLVQVAEGAPVIDGGVPIPVEDYAYDEEGNRTTSHLSALYSSNDHNQLLEDDGFTYAYDDRGNRVSKTSKADGSVESYSYDSQNRLVGYASPTTTASYAYDALDRRIAKDVDGASEAFIYDGSSVLLDYADGAFNTRWQHGPSIDEPLAFERAGTEYALHSDHLGSPREVVETATGIVAASYRYASFGARTQTGPLAQRYAFTGREEDLESGLIYYRARHYDPATGTFIQRDPIGFAGGDANLYAYVANNPSNFTDSSGLSMSSVEHRILTAGGVGLIGIIWCIQYCDEVGDALGGLPDLFDLGGSGGSSGGAGTSSPSPGPGNQGGGQGFADAVWGAASAAGSALSAFWNKIQSGIDESKSNEGSNGTGSGSGSGNGGTTGDTGTGEVGAAGGGCDPVAGCVGDNGTTTSVRKIVKDNNPANKQGYKHVVSRGVERGVWRNETMAQNEIAQLIRTVRTNKAWPRGTLPDTAKANQVLVPAGNNGLIVFRVGSNGTARFVTTLIRR
ncbi:tRNA nuclease WapA precursor [Pelagimonas phthalicica]|uniref:tRNA nuclease WapA n=1 Tax=Pelagimonas phthalicica TaxID=1037362 RepID=A0A238J6P4_9RHOB|nr:RHS repeat-associated core domain-containing protein [Pelagimonas phthalicica]TDS95432.1 RHS repeat-associated protein [Pelagimonas phthalicica]SMX26045.1 tRNA nuclease WapA precursor [Pelagimonas phthalicica]